MEVRFVADRTSFSNRYLNMSWLLFLITAEVFNKELFTILLVKVGGEGDSLGSNLSNILVIVMYLGFYNFFDRFGLFLVCLNWRWIECNLRGEADD